MAVNELRHLVHLVRVVPRPVLLVRQLRTQSRTLFSNHKGIAELQNIHCIDLPDSFH